MTPLLSTERLENEAQRALTAICNLAAIVKLQNGNQHPDINTMLADASEVCASLRLASRATAPVGVGIKPLEWTKKNPIRDNGDLRAHTVVGLYEVGKVAGRVLAILRCIRKGEAEDIDIGSFETDDLAKEAVEVDHEKRIRSALSLYSADAIAQLTRERDEAQREVEHFGQLAFVDIGANPPVAWKDHAAVLQARIAELEAALERQADNMAFLLNHVGVPPVWFEKFDRELAEDRAALSAKQENTNGR